MTLQRRSDWPVNRGSRISDLFDTDQFFRAGFPAVNIREQEKKYVVEIAAPGFEKKDFSISIDHGLLKVSAEHKRETKNKEENYTRQEFDYTAFSRSFNLPQNTDEEDINAKYEDGILKLSIAKQNGSDSQPRKSIQVN